MRSRLAYNLNIIFEYGSLYKQFENISGASNLIAHTFFLKYIKKIKKEKKILKTIKSELRKILIFCEVGCLT